MKCLNDLFDFVQWRRSDTRNKIRWIFIVDTVRYSVCFGRDSYSGFCYFQAFRGDRALCNNNLRYIRMEWAWETTAKKCAHIVHTESTSIYLSPKASVRLLNEIPEQTHQAHTNDVLIQFMNIFFFFCHLFAPFKHHSTSSVSIISTAVLYALKICVCVFMSFCRKLNLVTVLAFV